MHHRNTDGLTSSPRDWYCRAKYQNIKNSSAWIKLILVFSCIIFKPKLTTSHLHHGFRMFILSIIAPNVVQKLLPSFGFSFSSEISWDMRLDYLQDVQTALWPLCHQPAHECVTLFAGKKYWQPPLTTFLFLLWGLLGFLFPAWMNITQMISRS